MGKKLDEIAVFNEDRINETEVKIYAENFLELEGLLNKINELKEKYPYTKFCIEVGMH